MLKYLKSPALLDCTINIPSIIDADTKFGVKVFRLFSFIFCENFNAFPFVVRVYAINTK